MKKFFALILIAVFAVFIGCDETGNMLNPVLINELTNEEPISIEPAGYGPPPVGYEVTLNAIVRKEDVEIYNCEQINSLPFFEVQMGGDVCITYGYDPSVDKGWNGWDTKNYIKIGRPTMMQIPIYIFDPERMCMLERDIVEIKDYIAPHRIEIFNWNTGEPFRFHSPLWDNQPPEPINRPFRKAHTNKDSCPRKWFYRASLPVYFKYIPNDDRTSKEVPITSREIGIRIEFENGDKLTWNLSEIYPELPPFPPFRFRTEND
ncbi:MAG: hypothetical protein OXD49_19965 [Candidatus Poribacteria bacterium]|nr:hypothetical protein [Candidatus Poribacteria bacterium]